MSRHSIYWLWLTGIVVWWVPVPWSVPIVRGAGTGEAFFEQRIRPLLVERCIERGSENRAFGQAMDLLKKVDEASVDRTVVKQDVAFYKALCMVNLAIS